MKLNIDNGYDSDCEDKEETFEKQLPEHMYTVSLTSNVKGVYYSENRWCATWRINNKTITKRYSVKKYGEETAKSLAITKRAEMTGPNLIFYD